jgi:serine/threonine protein kinase
MPKPFKPEQFGRYLLTEKIATGGMAEIFNAKIFGAMGFEKSVVIKRILPQFAEDSEFLRMFITEAKLVCHLEHPNIVQVNELGEIDGLYYIAMEHVNGIDARHLWRTLAQRKQRLPGLLALFIVSEFLKGLDYAHRAVGPDGKLLGVVHRDVSPSNILISYRGDVKIGDFGIALVQQESKTQAGVLKGKFGYMSPEQVAGMKVDHRSDIFAAGIVLAELLLGRRLFLGQSDFETLDKVLNVRLDVLDEHENALPSEVVKIVRRALRRELAERYQSAQEFCDSIVEFLYDRRTRITNETLAAFIAEHVSPYLLRGGSRELSAPSVSGSPGRSLPVMPAGAGPIVPDTSALWYVASGGASTGPYTWQQVQEMAASGHIQQSDHLCTQKDQTWVPAAQVRGLFPQ